MEFYREYNELLSLNIIPATWCDPNARIVTPFDMLIDHATEAYITWEHQAPEHGSCGYGTWCATDREIMANSVLRINQLINSNFETYEYLMKDVWNACLAILTSRNVDLDKIPEYKQYFTPEAYQRTLEHFKYDLKFFFARTGFIEFNKLYNLFDNLIFEGAQGLGLDKDCGKEWHTTSSTGLTNPYNMLKDKEDFEAEVCYVSRSYVTRHGIGDLEEETLKEEINTDMVDKTNVTNEFQGSLRYAGMAEKAMEDRINKDWNIINGDSRFCKTLAITHCNEFPDLQLKAEYISNNPYSLLKR